MTREYPDRPVFGVGALVFDGDKVLLVKRGRSPRQGQGSLPGGAQKLGETVKQALVREVREETGLDVAVEHLETLVDIIDNDQDGKARHHYTVADYRCRVMGGTLAAGGDAAEAKWVAVKDLSNYDLTPKAKDVITAAWKR